MTEELLRVLAAYTGPLAVNGVVAGVEWQHEHPGFQYLRGGHPTPDTESRRGAATMLAALQTADEQTLVLFLISGGASAMLELPLDPGISVEDIAAFHKALVRSGLPIRSINVLRKHLSAVKGGRLAMAAPHSAQCTLLISDVPEGELDFVGSGPSLPDPSTVNDCRTILNATDLHATLPPSISTFFRSRHLPETPKPSDFAHPAPVVALLSSATLAEGAAHFAAQHGYHPIFDNSCDDQDYRPAADYLVRQFERLHRQDPRTCLISVGEVTVKITGEAGRGGRNQQFALECARINAGEEQPRIAVLSAGSDGIDGESPAAGAIADDTTWQRAQQLGIDPAAALSTFNSFPLFEALGDTIVTGPTGNNIRDLRVLITY
jgi:hydroxypyruvate reductase